MRSTTSWKNPRLRAKRISQARKRIMKERGFLNSAATRERMSAAHLGKPSPRKGKPFPQLRGAKNPNWTKDPSYTAVHKWVRLKYGAPQSCERCGETSAPDGKKNWFQWACRNKNYKRQRRCWRRLCTPCHRAYDKHPIRKGATPWNKK